MSKPITILVGPNSSGKSSLLKGLLAFKQTYGDTSDHAGFMSDGEYVDIGPFEEYVKDHNPRDDVEFIFDLGKSVRNLPSQIALMQFDRTFISVVHSEDPQSRQGRTKSYTAYFSSDPAVNIKNCETSPYYVSFSRMQTSEESFKMEISEELFGRAFDAGSALFGKKFNRQVLYDRVSKKMRRGHWRALRDNQRGMIIDSDKLFSDDTFVMSIVQNFLVQPSHMVLFHELTRGMFALAGLRQKPTRSVRRTDESAIVGSAGQNTASVYSDLRQKYIKAGSRQSRARETFSRLESWLSRMSLARGVELGSWRDLVDMRTHKNAAGLSDSVVDIGVGFSQAAPVLVQLASMPDETMMLVEQPELHLFPRAQTVLGQILCEEALRGRKRLIAETHSEHIVQGIQLHISNGRMSKGKCLAATDVQILYVDEFSNITLLEIDEFGEFITEWPEGFFDQTISVYRTIFMNKSK